MKPIDAHRVFPLHSRCLALTALLACGAASAGDPPEVDWDELNETQPWLQTEVWAEVPVVSPGPVGGPPSDAITLFDGTDLDEWRSTAWGGGVNTDQVRHYIANPEAYGGKDSAGWRVEDGVMVVAPDAANIATRRSFGDVQLHVEWLAPVAEGKAGQQYSNSGIFLMGLYEIQVLNSHGNPTYANGQAGSVYKQHIPLVNASRPPGEWQSYDILFRAPRFTDDGRLAVPAEVTVLHNGVVVQLNARIQGPTFYIGAPHYVAHPDRMPLVLQNHGDPVRFRNIWIREL